MDNLEQRQTAHARRVAEEAAAALWLIDNAKALEGTVAVDDIDEADGSEQVVLYGDAGDLDADISADRATAIEAETTAHHALGEV